jgi:hypothetical protein
MSLIRNPTRGTINLRSVKEQCSFNLVEQLDRANSSPNDREETLPDELSFAEDYTREHSL